MGFLTNRIITKILLSRVTFDVNLSVTILIVTNKVHFPHASFRNTVAANFVFQCELGSRGITNSGGFLTLISLRCHQNICLATRYSKGWRIWKIWIISTCRVMYLSIPVPQLVPKSYCEALTLRVSTAIFFPKIFNTGPWHTGKSFRKMRGFRNCPTRWGSTATSGLFATSSTWVVV